MSNDDASEQRRNAKKLLKSILTLAHQGSFSEKQARGAECAQFFASRERDRRHVRDVQHQALLTHLIEQGRCLVPLSFFSREREKWSLSLLSTRENAQLLSFVSRSVLGSAPRVSNQRTTNWTASRRTGVSVSRSLSTVGVLDDRNAHPNHHRKAKAKAKAKEEE